MITVSKTTNKTVESGDIITDYRGDRAKFVMATRANNPGKSGKIVVKYLNEGGTQREFYDHVFNLSVIGDE
jgi:hypothetical protein